MNETATIAEPTDFLAKAGEAAAFLRSLAHEHRLAILCVLEDGPLNVGEIALALDLAQPKVSQHLMRLRAEGLVTTERAGTTIHYSVTSEPARAIAAVLKAAFCPPARRSRAKK